MRRQNIADHTSILSIYTRSLDARFLLEEGEADINARDRWDSVPLYYACLAGHSALAGALLEAGAVCNEYTFDGDRCHYACALVQSIESTKMGMEMPRIPTRPIQG